MRGRLRIVLGLVVALAVMSTGVALALAREPAPQPLEVVAGRFGLRGTGDGAALVPIHRFEAGEAQVPSLDVFARPHPAPGEAPVSAPRNPTAEGFPLVVAVLDASADGDWLHVRLPQRPNGTTGWVRSADLRTWEVPNRIEVSLGAHRLTVYDGDSDRVLFTTDVATGRPATPTPLGDFYIDIVNPLGNHRTYGWGQLSVAGFSDVLERFAGGIGQIAIHGWNDDSVMGRSASNGCIRMRNGDIAQVAALAPLGTPVSIVP